MNRRRLLAGTGLVLASPLAGCLNRSSGGNGRGDDGTVTPVGRTPSTPSEDECGSAGQSLSARLTDLIGDPDYCFDGVAPSLVVENERAERVTVHLELETPDGFAETYTLDPGERAVESRAFETRPGVGGTVTIEDDGEYAVKWPECSCYRYGVAIRQVDLKIGWLGPLQGPGDTQHDCYPGTAVPLEIGAAGEHRTVAATIVDRCTDGTFQERVQIPADRRERIDGELVSGGMYDVTIDVEGGGSATY